MRMSAVPLFKSMRTRSPFLRSAKPPPAAASGEALRIEGDPEVPDCRPSPMQGSECTPFFRSRSEEHTSELQSQFHLVCRLLLEKKKRTTHSIINRVACS